MAIQFLNNVNADNGVLYVDAINNSVGIGTTSPTARLVVTSSNLDDANTLKINHTRNDANVATRAVVVDMILSGADTTTADRTNYGIFVDLDSSADGDATDEHRIYGVGSDVRFTGFSDLARGAYFYVESNNNTEKTGSIAGVEAKVIHDSNSTNGGVSNMYGVFGSSNIQDLGDVDNAYGGYFTVELGNNRGSADFGVSKGVEGHINIDKASTVNYGAMTAVSGIIDNNEGTVPNFGNQYLFKGDYQGTKGSNAYGIYTEGDKHYFDGNIGVGNTAPTSKLTIGGNGITTKIATATISDTTAGASLTLRGGSPTIYFDRTGDAPESKILMDNAGLEFKTGTLDAEGDVDFKIKADGKLQAPAYTQGFLQSDASGNIEISGGGTLPGGPYLPLDGGTMTGDLLMDGKAGVGNVIGLASGTLSDAMSLKLYTYNNIDPGGGLGTSTGNMIQADLGSNLVLRQTANDGDITFQSDDGSGGIATYFQLDGSHMQSIAWKDIHFVDGIKAKFGDYASPDLQIYHDGSNSYIDETGTGNLKIRSNRLQLEKYTGETMAEFIADGASSLYYDNSKKLETTSTGVSVTGTATATTFSGDLNGTINTATTAVTKANATNDTTVATTAFVQNLIGTIPAGLVFQGTWNAATNTPTLASGSGTTGHFYIVSTDGSTNLDGITDWKVGDWAVFVEQGATDAWEKVDNSSVLDGAGTGQTVAMWSGSGTSNTLTNAPITFSGNDATFTGNIHLDNDSSQLQFGDDNDMQIYHNGANGKINNTLGNFNIDSAGDITLDADGGDIRLYDGGVLYGNLANGAGNFQIKNPTQDMDISFIGNDGGSNVTALTLDMSEGGNATFAGDVGIGVSPSQPLDVNGTALIRNTIYVGDDIQHWGDGGTGMYFGTDTISLKNDGGSTRLFVKSGGNVGIGTTSPNYKLEVDGTLGVSRTDGIIFAGSSGLGTGSKIVSNTSNDLIFNTALTSLPYTTTERVRILNNGNVGIGATSPADKLEVKDGSIRLNSTSSYPSTNVIKATWNGSTSPPMGSIGWEQNPGFIGSEWSHYKQTSPYTQARIRLIGDASSGGMFVNLNGSDVFTIKASTGNVGIGTTNPGAKLDIFNTGGSAGSLADCQTYSALTIKPYSSVDSKLTFSANGISTQLIQATNNAGTTGRQISLQPFSGNVGIGVILPSEKLDVNGHIKAFNGYKGYVSDFNNGGFFHSPRSTDGANPLFIPINSTGMTSSDQYYNTWVPLYAGRVRKIILKHVSGSTPVATVCTFRKKINGVLSGTTYAGTVTNGGAVGMKVTFDFGTSNFTFNAEDEVQIGVVTGVATQPRMGGMSYQIWYEYNVT